MARGSWYPPQLVTPSAWNRIRERADVVARRDRLALVSDATPFDGMVADLVFLRRALDAAGVGVLLVRGEDHRPVIAVDAADRDRAWRAIVDASADEPLYSQAVGTKAREPKGQPVLVADGRLASKEKANLLRLWRPRVDSTGSVETGEHFAVQLEFWRRKGGDIVVPVENALTRARIPADEVRLETVERYGQEWQTIESMFAEHANDVTFDIDMVFSWVDGTDKEWQRARARRMASYVVGEGDDADARFRQIDELKYALRSVHTYMPWVRNIYIATDSPAPAWLDEHPRVRVVRSEEFFQNADALPTHNSMAVESQLHHIPGLSEYFLYSNDDMFIGRPVGPEMFFSPGGVTKFIEAPTRIGLGDNAPRRSGFENAARVNRRLLQERFGRVTTRHLEHAATPLRKSVLHEMEREFREDFARTAGSVFRAADNISVTNSLYHYYSLMTGRAVVKVGAKVVYVDTTMRAGLALMKQLLKRRDQDFFCLNDGSFPEVGPEERSRKVRAFLDRYFPVAAPWERPVEAELPPVPILAPIRASPGA